MAKAAVPHMKPGSAIVITGSVTGIKGNKNLLDYSATKVEFMPSPARSRRISSIAAFASTQLRPARYGPPSTGGQNLAHRRAAQQRLAALVGKQRFDIARGQSARIISTPSASSSSLRPRMISRSLERNGTARITDLRRGVFDPPPVPSCLRHGNTVCRRVGVHLQFSTLARHWMN
jgi:hypothetical protein